MLQFLFRHTLFLAIAASVAADAAAGQGGSPTYARDVAPIFRAKCESCHRPNSIGPMSLVSWEAARPWARSISTRVASRQMPPWHIDKDIGIQQFENDRSLSDQEIDTVVKWVAAGAPRGDLADMPPPVRWPDDEQWNFESRYGPPDLVLRSPPYTVPAGGVDLWYKPVTPTGLTEPRWVRAIEMRPATPAGRRVTHHALARLQQHDASEPKPDVDIGPGLFMEWAVGKQGEVMRPDSGKLLLPGSTIVWDVHYHPIGETISTNLEMAIYFYPKDQAPKHRQVLGIFHALQHGPRGLDIPPNTVTVHQGVFVMRKAGRIENFQPHMHLRGKGMSMEAITPDGRTRVLSLVSNYQFNWHNNYVYASEAAPILPKGTVLRLTAWHDNTKNNKDNPDPDQWVGWGDRTIDEMAHAWVNITYFSEEEYSTHVTRTSSISREPQP